MALPKYYQDIKDQTEASGFTMASDLQTGMLLRTLAASKPKGSFLEIGTGTGLSTSWLLDGMDEQSRLISIDHDPTFLKIARQYLAADERLTLELADGASWLLNRYNQRVTLFDFIFADSWHGKYLLLDEALSLLNPYGLYIIDDMLPQPNWPDGHDIKVSELLERLNTHPSLCITILDWSTGIVIATKKH
jgi:predicted O-methyltransferase YrrM